VESTARGLRSGRIKPRDLDPIRVFYGEDGRLTSLDNRRLLAAQLAGTPVDVMDATPTEVSDVTRKRQGHFRDQPNYRNGPRKRR
jgi:hypothetical protein